MRAHAFVDELRRVSPGEVVFGPPASEAVIARTEAIVGALPEDHKAVLRVANGIACRRFRLLSALDEARPKATWECIERGQATVFDDGDELRVRFLCIADIGDGYALYDRDSSTVWFLEGDDRVLQRTDMGLLELIRVAVIRTE